MPSWYLIRKSGNFTETGARHGIPAAAARLMVNRGIDTDEKIEKYLHGSLKDMYDPGLMKDMDGACRFIAAAVTEGKKIRVIGDYDIDGVTSTAILVKGLRALGADVSAAIPHRIKDGYGMNARLIEEAKRDRVEVILTCDNGISARAEAELAAKYGISLVITDHHEVPYEETPSGRRYLLPGALYIVDPKQEDCTYPFKDICGGMIAFKFISYLYDNALAGNRFANVYENSQFREELMQLAALATVGDIMPLIDENRIILKEALKCMQSTPAPGLNELIDVNGIDRADLNAFQLGFVIGPCINAAGRLDSADKALLLFLEDNKDEAMRRAGELKEYNVSRKTMTEAAVNAALDIAENEGYDKDRVLVIFIPDCHESVAGIVAGRLRERFSKPVFVLTRAESGLKGSGRSIPAYNMYAEMTKISEIFTKYGGHEQAAGFSIEEKDLDTMRRRLNENCTLTEEDLKGKLMIDMELPLSYADERLLDALKLMEPFGGGNDRPVFARRGLELRGIRIMGAKKNCAKLKVSDNGTEHEIMLFKGLDLFNELMEKKYGVDVLTDSGSGKIFRPGLVFNAAYTAAYNVFRGEKKIQLTVEDFF